MRNFVGGGKGSLKKTVSPEGGVSSRQSGGWRWVDSLSRAGEQHAQSQEVREQECAGKERSVKCQKD